MTGDLQISLVNSPNERVGRGLAASQQGQDMVVVRDSTWVQPPMAGSSYMDTGILSNTGEVNSASIPAIVASEASNVPIIQLNGGSI